MSSHIGDNYNNDSHHNDQNPPSIFNDLITNTINNDILSTSTRPVNLNNSSNTANILRPSGMIVGPDDPVFRQTYISKPKIPLKYDPIGPFGIDTNEDVAPSLNTSQFNPLIPFDSDRADDFSFDNIGSREVRNPKSSSMDHPFNFTDGPNMQAGFHPRHFPF